MSTILPIVRIRCPQEQEARTTSVLDAAGFAAERSLTWLLVRNADPDAVNAALVAGGAYPRTAVRERIGQLIGWVIDKEGKFEGRGANVEALVRRVLEEGAISTLYRPRPTAALLEAASELYEHILDTGAGFVSFTRFASWFLEAVS